MTYEIVKITVRPLLTSKWQQKYLELASSNADQQLMPCFVHLQDMALPFVMVLPLLIVVSAGVYYIYNEIILFMSKSLVRNKVVVITDAVSGVGTGKWYRINKFSDSCKFSLVFAKEHISTLLDWKRSLCQCPLLVNFINANRCE